jgi:hypothetical protein
MTKALTRKMLMNVSLRLTTEKETERSDVDCHK